MDRTYEELKLHISTEIDVIDRRLDRTYEELKLGRLARDPDLRYTVWIVPMRN